MGLWAAIFWACVLLIAYTYAIYAALIWCAARLFGKHSEPGTIADEQLPPITLLIAAYNEADVIAERVRNALAMEYPAGKVQIVVASDGSSDATANVVRTFADRSVQLFNYTQRRGKASVLNSAMAEIESEIVLLSDANTDIAPDAARNLVRWFSDPKIGAVCGRLVLVDSETGRNADGLYWRYETFLKKAEAKLGALLGSNGAIYAIRRDRYVPIPANTIVDDFVIPLLAKLNSGCRIVYDCDAVASEETAPDVKAEFRRRARIGAGGFQAIALLWRLMSPRWGWLAFAFVSHKVLRWLCPFLLAAMLISSVIAAAVGQPLYWIIVAAQVAFYVVSLLTSRLPGPLRRMKMLRLATMFTSMNAALAVGFWRWVNGVRSGTWERTARGATTATTVAAADETATAVQV
jgi:cellulose synthase/poly-beta-1,6-N-acetylglucosamine synthase-like glycosyltransferase